MRLIDRLKGLFEEEQAAPEAEEASLALATAILLFEVAWADHQIEDAELERLRQALATSLALSAEDIDAIVDDAHDRQAEHVGVFEYTRLVNEQCSAEERLQLVTNLWRIAYSDGTASAIEEHTVRRISELLYVPHKQFIEAKQRARGES